MGNIVQLTAVDGFTLAGYQATASGQPKGALVIAQEIFGVNHHIRNVVDRFAAQGYTALAPALFDRAQRGVEVGYDDAGIATGRDLRGRIKLEDTLLDVAAAVAQLRGIGRIGVVGYCWGGSLAFLAATRIKDVACAVGYYGGMIAAHADEKPAVPVMLHFGDKDHSIPSTDVDKIRRLRPEIEIFTYPADHGFSCDERSSFHEPSHRLALDRSLAFFQKHLAA